MQLRELAEEVARDEQLADRIQRDPAGELRRLSNEPAYKSDVWVYRGVVAALGIAIVLAAAGAILLAVVGSEVPELLIALGSAAVGALAGLLAPSPQAT